MLGRAAYQNPWVLAECQRELFTDVGGADGEAGGPAITDYLSAQLARGVPVKNISRHLLGLFQGLPGARLWRRFISEHAHLDAGNGQLLMQALDAMEAVRPASSRHVA